MDIVLYSTGCPRCSMLEHMLETKEIDYQKIDDIDKMLDLGFTTVPVLSVDGKLMDYQQSVTWLAAIERSSDNEEQ